MKRRTRFPYSFGLTLVIALSVVGFHPSSTMAASEPPMVESIFATNIVSTSANLEATVNGNGFETHYHFEYLTQAQFEAGGESFSAAQQTPETNLGPVGNQTASAQVERLAPGTAYRFRIVATNENGEAFGANPAPLFITFAIISAGLPDARAYEMVSPPEKTGEVFAPFPRAGSCAECLPGEADQMMPMQSSPTGDAIVYQGQPFAEGLAAGPNEYISRRFESQWSTQSLSSPSFGNGRVTREGYQVFSSDLSRSVLFQIQPALTPEAPTLGGKAYPNLYLRDEGGSLQPIITEEPPNRVPGALNPANEFRITYGGANVGTASISALSHVIFEANDALTDEVADTAPKAPGVEVEQQNIYEWVRQPFGVEQRLVNVLPGNSATAPSAVIGSGHILTPVPTKEVPAIDHAISDDGSRIFWSEETTGQVYARIDGEETRKIEDPGAFLTASSDGSKVLLNDGCLYHLDTDTCEDLTEGQNEFQGILGASDDLSRIYFVATAALTGEEENANQEQAEAGKFNLYIWENGVPIFIGILLGIDNEVGGIAILRRGDWTVSSSNRTAQVSSDGQYLAFMSQASLTGYDNAHGFGGVSCNSSSVPQPGVPCFEVFEYNAATNALSCASCNPTAQRPLGKSSLSLIQGILLPLPQPSNLSPEGEGRLFFESQDILSPYDNNGSIQDVYEWEPKGVGSCEATGGCISLISSGNNPNDSLFLNASRNGDDAFFVTRERLLKLDQNEQLDLYDARAPHMPGELVGFHSAESSACVGGACREPSPAPPIQPSATSSTFHSSGNPPRHSKKPRRKKGHHKKNGRPNDKKHGEAR